MLPATLIVSDYVRNFFQKALNNNSHATLILTALGAATWLIGGNLVVMMHYRRVGKSFWTALSRPEFPFFRFNLKEWCMLALVAVIAMCLLGSGISH